MNSIDIRLPEAESATAGAEIIQWHVAPGRRARASEVLVSLDAGESVIEIAAPCDGVLSRVLAGEGDWLEPGALLAEFAPGAAVGGAPASEASPEETLTPLRGSETVRRIARELRLELEAIHGIEGDRLSEATPV
ncbi:MAG: biotin/lipoyl-containing protein [Gammaproteobacteria bacterium]